ncbi:MAG: amidohydrolase family protein [Candidatus Bathyarchaeia archaeon]|jgi:putative selenium metabolism protein SsnA
MTSILVKGGIIVTMDPRHRILSDHSIIIDEGKFKAIGKTGEITKHSKTDEIVDASGSIVMPGLICSHTHLYGILLRGAKLNITPPSDFTQILQRIWWPVDESLTFDDAYASALVACLEFLKTGTTTFADTYSGPNSIEGVLDRIAKAVEEVGIRGLLSFEATERHSKEEGERGVRENVRFAQSMKREKKSRALPLFSLHASFTVTDELIRSVRELASKYSVPITIHTSEGLGDPQHNIERYGKRTIERLHDIGLLAPDVVLAHCVHLNDNELNIVAKTGAKVAHNPMSNMLNAVGTARVPDMLRKGISVGLGNDGYIFDGFDNMRAAYLIHRSVTRDPNAIDAYEILEMATIRGAELYGLERQIGSIERGKRADLIVIKPDILPTPLNPDSVVGHLINTIDGDDVRTTIVDGRIVMKDRTVTTLDEIDAQGKGQDAAAALWQRLRTMKSQVDLILPSR